ncbi:MAG: cytochrome-c oxidase, cbb3-type subunit III [Betaproteobacteria bacterium]
MSGFWSAWVMVLVTINLGVALFLFVWGRRVHIPTLPDGTTGHVWAHGVIREGVHWLPKWWVLMSVALFIATFSYLTLYPGFGNSRGMLNWTSAGELQDDTATNQLKLDPLLKVVSDSSVAQLSANPEALRIGHRLFVDNCSPCHGSGARGNHLLGAPDLTDGDWLYGGDEKSLLSSILDGRTGAMPAFAGTLDEEAIGDLTHYVRSLPGLPHDSLRAALGKRQFGICTACHGADAKGNLALGAPNLNDSVWLYGGSSATIAETIRHGRAGVMPAWRGRLGDDDAKMVAAWVYAQSHPVRTPVN